MCRTEDKTSDEVCSGVQLIDLNHKLTAPDFGSTLMAESSILKDDDEVYSTIINMCFNVPLTKYSCCTPLVQYVQPTYFTNTAKLYHKNKCKILLKDSYHQNSTEKLQHELEMNAD
ncbi:hypothetical protein AMECASPLE_031067 [Ameca splendens]|uniref:Uncharacterized protein n=1 Tax=Ameca splendens TaxID=208324 RepID=A0ABV0XV31_9TELE